MASGATHPAQDPCRYEIRIQGRLEQRWSTWLDGMAVTPGTDGTTVVTGTVADQSALHGLLTRIGDLGLPLIAVTRLVTAPAHDNPRSDKPDNLIGD